MSSITRESYMKELESLLQKVPEPLRKEWLYDYYIHFQQAYENGQTEQEAAAELGDPRLIANELLLSYRVAQAESKNSVGNLSRAVFATAGMGLFNLIFVLGPYIGVAGVLFSLWGTTAALALAGLAIVIDSQWNGTFSIGQAVSLGLICLSLSMLMGVGVLKLTRMFTAATLKYLQFNTRVIRGAGK
ncbi:HAAS signaling domain-containing protein [Paenibacillus gorillae]|uniref:HAAS signaling domain-containing protein n=1 Tax=Paenibacillus gorillae TaxID=1243662 RepID=UPI0004AFC829|nr:DUF1700 domain-containing protein [Paenibacillus gorillae]